MDEEIIQELFKKDDEIGKLQAYVFKMEKIQIQINELGTNLQAKVYKEEKVEEKVK